MTSLENHLGERLLTRSTRRLTLTEFGTGILEHAKRLREEADAVSAYAQHRHTAVRGTLRVSMPPDFGDWILGPLFLQFAASYPDVKLELDLSPRRVDLIGEQFDLALRVAPRLPDDATLVARRLGTLESGLYASPAYLKHFGTPTRPEELMTHTALQLVASNGEPQRWKLSCGQAAWEGLPAGPVAANSVSLMRLLASHGLGIAALSDRYVADALADGVLQRVLPEWKLPDMAIWAVMPGRRLIPARTRVFLAALEAAMRSTTR